MPNAKIKKSASVTKNKKTAIPAMPVVKTDVKKVSVSAPRQITFQIQAKPGSNVFLAGDFNNWDYSKKKLLDKDGNGFYQGKIMLKPGTYEYKFFINDTWCVDPENHKFRPNEVGTLNSVIIVE